MPDPCEILMEDSDTAIVTEDDQTSLIVEHCEPIVELPSVEFRTVSPVGAKEKGGTTDDIFSFLKDLDPTLGDPLELSHVLDVCNEYGVLKADLTPFPSAPNYDPFVRWSDFYGMLYYVGPDITATAGHVGWTDIGWNCVATMPGGGDIPNDNIVYRYEVATDANMTNIVNVYTNRIFQNTFVWRNATADTDYWLRIRYTIGLVTLPGSMTPVKNTTNPCTEFSYIDNTNTLRVFSSPGTQVTVMSDLNNNLLGATRRVADDEFGNLFLTTSQGSIRDSNGDYNPTGRCVFDAGFPKYGSYTETAAGLYNTTGGERVGLVTLDWTTSHRDALLNGADIYDSSIFPPQFTMLANTLKFVQRPPNLPNNSRTNKILYINDADQVYVYSCQRFRSGVRDVAEAIGLTFDELSVTTGTFTHHQYPGNHIGDSHYQALTVSWSQTQWETYLANYDCIVWFGTSALGHYTLPANFINAFKTFFNSGGGLFATTDHATNPDGQVGDYFQQIINQLIYPYFGVFFTGRIDRTTQHASYQVSSILNNNAYIPSGWHPLFDGIDPSLHLHAGASEGRIAYDTTYSSTQAGTTNSSSWVDVTVSPTADLFINTSNECGAHVTGR